MKTKKNLPHACAQSCPVTYCLSQIGGKWKPLLLFLVHDGYSRFSQLEKIVEGISKQMLTKQLRELEGDGLLNRTILAEIPPHVEYRLTTKGIDLMPIISAMKNWGQNYLPLSQVNPQHKEV